MEGCSRGDAGISYALKLPSLLVLQLIKLWMVVPLGCFWWSRLLLILSCSKFRLADFSFSSEVLRLDSFGILLSAPDWGCGFNLKLAKLVRFIVLTLFKFFWCIKCKPLLFYKVCSLNFNEPSATLLSPMAPPEACPLYLWLLFIVLEWKIICFIKYYFIIMLLNKLMELNEKTRKCWRLTYFLEICLS